MEFFCVVDWSLLPHLFIYSNSCISMNTDIDGYLFYTLGYNSILLCVFFAHIVLALVTGTPFSWFLCAFNILLACVALLLSFVSHPYFLALQDTSVSCSICPAQSLISHFSKNHCFFYWKMELEAKIWVSGYLLVLEEQKLLQVLSAYRARRYVCILTHA